MLDVLVASTAFGFMLRLESRVQLALRVEILEDRFDDDVRLRHAAPSTSAVSRASVSSRFAGSG